MEIIFCFGSFIIYLFIYLHKGNVKSYRQIVMNIYGQVDSTGVKNRFVAKMILVMSRTG